MITLNESKLGGLSLFLGSLLILITIVFELKIGWVGVERPSEEVPGFIYESWSSLKLIWGWQMVGQFLWAVAFLLLMKNTTPYLRLAWSVLFILALMVVIAFGITLGGYGPALEVYESQPAIFDALRGAVRSLYEPLMFSLLLLIAVFLFETFSKTGRISRLVGLVTVGLVVVGILLEFVAPLPAKVTSAAVFFVPLVLGFSYFRS